MLTGNGSNSGNVPLIPAVTSARRSATCQALLFACAAKVIKLRKGKDIIVAGSQPQSLYVNHDGWLFRYKILHNGCRQIVNFVLPGEIFGLQACVFKNSLYSVAALTEATLSAIPIETVGKAAECNAKLSNALFYSAICEAAILGEHLIDTGRRSAYGRVSHFLLELFVRLEQAGQADALSFDMPLTQEVIGDALGLSPVHVNRTLRALRDDKLVAFDGKRVTLCDFGELCRLSDFEDCYLGKGRHRDATAATDALEISRTAMAGAV
jgi:CRP-like cAMP-binding protein